MAARVRSDDAGNLEAQAARLYWGKIFGDRRFRRGSEEPNQNRHLDYGYTVLRAAVARALCAAGLHPSIGLRHKNRYNVLPGGGCHGTVPTTNRPPGIPMDCRS